MEMIKKVAVITGGTRGLGREIALAFFENGYRVVINYIKSDKPAEELVKIMGDRPLLLKADVSRSEEVAEIARHVYDSWGKIDVLVNNAGVTKDSVLIRQRAEDWDNIINTNLKGAFNSIKSFAPLMTEGGHIINISSYSGLKGKEGQAAYSASKAALLGLTKTAALELAAQSIRVNAVLPGYMPAGMGLGAGAALDKAKNDSLLKVLSDPKEVAEFIVHLSGMKNVTGQIFCLDSRII